jgi:hypothetical protein
MNETTTRILAATHPGLGFSPEAAVGAAVIQTIRQIVREELAARLKPPETEPISPWMTPPAASRASGVPVKSIRAWARNGLIPRRLKNTSTAPKQQKYLVNLNDVAARAEQKRVADRGGEGEIDRARVRVQEILAAHASTRR